MTLAYIQYLQVYNETAGKGHLLSMVTVQTIDNNTH